LGYTDQNLTWTPSTSADTEPQEESLKFYQEVMGMTLMRTSEQKEAGFNLYFLGYPGGYDYKKPTVNGVNPVAGKEGLLELTWNYGKGKEKICL
jgi:lactoylglutathione lyase